MLCINVRMCGLSNSYQFFVSIAIPTYGDSEGCVFEATERVRREIEVVVRRVLEAHGGAHLVLV